MFPATEFLWAVSLAQIPLCSELIVGWGQPWCAPSADVVTLFRGPSAEAQAKAAAKAMTEQAARERDPASGGRPPRYEAVRFSLASAPNDEILMRLVGDYHAERNRG